MKMRMKILFQVSLLPIGVDIAVVIALATAEFLCIPAQCRYNMLLFVHWMSEDNCKKINRNGRGNFQT